MGYANAWERRRALLSVLVPVLVPASLILLALRLLAAPEDATVINGALVTLPPDDLLGLVYALVAGLAWLLAITAGIIAVGRPWTGTKEVLRKAANALVYQAFVAVAAIAATFAVFMVAGWLGLLGIALLILYAFVLARFALVLPARALDGDASWALAEGRTLGTALRIGIGVAVAPLLVLRGSDLAGAWLLELMPYPATAFLVKALGTLVLIAIVAVQASTLAAVYLDLRGDDEPPKTQHIPVGRAWVLAASLVLVPAIVAAALAPSHGPNVVVRHAVLAGWGNEIVIVDGQKPVIFSEYGYYRCDDNTCRTGDSDVGTIAAREHTAVGMDGDGALLEAEFSRRGSDRLRVTRCAPACGEGGGTVTILDDASSRALPRFDVAGGKDATIWIALAQQKNDEPTIELSLIRCAGRNCNESRRIVAGTIGGELDASDWNDHVTVHLRLDSEGRAIADFDFGYGEIHTAACHTAACDTTSLTRHEDPRILPQQTAGHTKAIVVNERGIFAVTAEPATQPEQGFYVRFDSPAAEYERLVLWHCTDTECENRRRYPLHTRQRPPVVAFSGDLPFVSPIPHSDSNVHLAVLPDGTVLITEGSTLISLRL